MTDTQARKAAQTTFVAQMLAWFNANPGWHAPKDVAAAMGAPTQTVAARCLYLADHGQLARLTRMVGKAKRSVYAAP